MSNWVANPTRFILTISDMGTGLDQQRPMDSNGLGLISMRERLQLMNGTMVIESTPGHGTIIRARVCRSTPILGHMDSAG